MVKQIIKEAMEKNPIGLKEAVEAELAERLQIALEAKRKSYKEEDEHDHDDDDDEQIDEDSTNYTLWDVNIGNNYKNGIIVKESVDLSELTLEELKDFIESTEFDQLDEISKKLARNYYRKSSKDVGRYAASANDLRSGSDELKRRIDRNYNRDGSRTTDDDRKRDRDMIAKYDTSRKSAERKLKNRAVGISRAAARQLVLDKTNK